MRLSLRGANPAEWLALRAGLVPTAAAEAWAGMALSGVIIAGVQSGVTARLSEEGATAAELADDLGLDPLPTRLLLDCLRSCGHLTCQAGRYELSRSSRRWLDPGSDLSVARFAAGTADYWTWWSGLPEVIRGGRPFGHHDAPADDPYWQRYISGQLELARLSAREVARKLRLPRHARSLLDIGGGHGWYSAELCRRHPQLTATVLDLPGSAAIGREIIARAGMTDRVRHRDGDATTVELGAGLDCVLCFNLIHHLARGDIVALFARVHEALEIGGTFAVMDAFAEPSYRKSAAANFLAMFVYLSSGAQVYTPAQLHGWLTEAGFPAPRRRSILRIPGQALYVARKGRPADHLSGRSWRAALFSRAHLADSMVPAVTASTPSLSLGILWEMREAITRTLDARSGATRATRQQFCPMNNTIDLRYRAMPTHGARCCNARLPRKECAADSPDHEVSWPCHC